MNGIVRNQNRARYFHCLTRHAGKGVKGCLKKLIVEDVGGNKNTLLDRSYIEENIIESSACHFKQAKNTPTFTDKTHDKLTEESVRNKTLNGALRRK